MLDLPGDNDLKPVFLDDTAWAIVEGFLAADVHPDCRFRWLAFGEVAVERHGLQGFREGWVDWCEPWAEYRSRTEDLMELEDGRVLVLARQMGRSADGNEIEMHAAAVCEVRDGLLTSIDFHAKREEALEAVGRRA
jgi:ketosteroid isomerase-like protein